MMKLRLFGGFELTDAAGGPVILPARKDQALLTHLALSNGAAREQLTALLWADRAERQARKSLRQSLVVLRRVLNENAEVLPADRRQVLSLAVDGLDVDARRFETLARKGDLASLRAAARLYNDALLQHFSVPAKEFSDWLDGQRRRFDDIASGVFEALAEKLLTREDWTEAEAAARRLIAINSLRETGYRLLMRALAGGGRRTEALQQFHGLSGLLRQELDVRPDLDSVALYQRIRQHSAAMARGSESAGMCAAGARPGLAVLPLRFGDAEDAALADGLSEEIIASLAAYRWFFVISGLQAMTYRDRNVTPVELAAELGVGYVLDGVIRRSGNQMRIRLNLCETIRGELIWSDTIDCYFDETLQAQNELARWVAGTIEPELLRGEDEGHGAGPTGDMDAWHLSVRARRLADLVRLDTLNQAEALAAQAIELKPDSVFGHAALAWTLWLRGLLFRSSGGDFVESLSAAERAIDIDDRFFLGHAALGVSLIHHGEFDGSVASLRRAIDLNPSFPTVYNQLTSCLTRGGKPGEAVDYIEPLDRISPHDPYIGYYQCVRAMTYYMLGDDPAAIENAKASLTEHPVWLASELVLIAASQRTGQALQTAQALDWFRENHADASIEYLRSRMTFRYDSDFQVLAEPLCAAGVPVV